MRRVWKWAIAVLAALMVFPLLFVAQVLRDTLVGERLFTYQLAHEQRLLLETFLADYRSALPLSLAATAIVVLAARSASRWAGVRAGLLVATATSVIAFGGLLAWMGGTFATATPIAATTVAGSIAPHFLLVGGGPKPSASESQIEFNVTWVQQSLRQLAPGAPVRTWFADGNGPAPTSVRQASRGEEPDPPFDALASAYGESTENRLRYRRHSVPDVLGTTERDSLLPELRRYLRSLSPGDQAMLVYNGHGTWERDRAENSLRLWDESRLSVRDFQSLLEVVDTVVPVRFVLTQCYSGAFARAITPDVGTGLELVPGARCGFFAESSERQSEGCSASLGLGDYRDYTTYFFAGLTGRDRLGREVPRAVDRDTDGRLTPFDAHLHVLAEGYNGDLPRSTSEDWLERWQGWAARWAATGVVPDNVYGRLAREIARGAGLPEDGSALGGALTAAYDSLTSANTATLRERDAVAAAVTREREELQARLERRWPQLAHPYTASYRDLLLQESPAIETMIRGDMTYPGIQARQVRLDSLESALVDLDRRISRLDRLRRTRQLARSLQDLERRGSERDRTAYGRLRACEALPLGTP